MAAFRYVALNPVRAGLVQRASDWPWSSTRAHLLGKSTAYVDVEPALSRIETFAAFLAPEPQSEAQWSEVLKAEQIGRPVGGKAWVEHLEHKLDRRLTPQKRGPKPRAKKLEAQGDPNLPLFSN